MFVRCRAVYLLVALSLFGSAGQAREGRLVQRVYAVSDLVATQDKESAPATSDEQLIKMITETIAPRSWSAKGGCGTIDYFPQTMALVVCQTPEVQDQIHDLLTAMHRQQEMQVRVEVKFLHIDQSMLEKLKQQGLFKESKGKEVLSLDKAQMIRFMQVAQSDTHCKLLQIAKLAMRNGQTAATSAGDDQQFVTGLEIVSRNGRIEYMPKKETIPLGPQIKICSHVSADRRRVRLHVDAKVNNLDSPKVPRFRITTPDPNGEAGTVTHTIERPKISTYGMKRTMVIPDGNTAVLTGGTFHCVQATVSKVPTLGDIPYLGSLFRTVTYEERQTYLLVLVTPRIQVHQETEAKQASKVEKAVLEAIQRCGGEDADDFPDAEEVFDAALEAIHRCGGEKTENDFRTPILPPYREHDPLCSEAPKEGRILRALPPLRRLAGVYEESRDDVAIVTEHSVDKIEPPRFFPLVGPAQLHRCQWKCSVYYEKTIKVSYPFCFRWTQRRMDVVYVDTDHLHLVAKEKTPQKRERDRQGGTIQP